MIKRTIAEELRAKESRDNRELLDHAAAHIENLERERDALEAENVQLKMEIDELNAKTFKNRIYAIWEAFVTKVNEIYENIADLGADIVRLIGKLKRWHRRRKRDRRIIKQAKAAGVWYSPQCLGGRALELKAWRAYKIKREPGEKDVNLRSRCINEMRQRIFERRKITRTVILKERPTLRNMRRWCEITERVAEKYGYKISKREINKVHDGYEATIHLVDGTLPKDLTVTISYDKEEKSTNEE